MVSYPPTVWVFADRRSSNCGKLYRRLAGQYKTPVFFNPAREGILVGSANLGKSPTTGPTLNAQTSVKYFRRVGVRNLKFDCSYPGCRRNGIGYSRRAYFTDHMRKSIENTKYYISAMLDLILQSIHRNLNEILHPRCKIHPMSLLG